MYDAGKSSAGKEFEAFVKVSDKKGQVDYEFALKEYHQLICLTFFNEIFMQMRKTAELDDDNEEFFD